MFTMLLYFILLIYLLYGVAALIAIVLASEHYELFTHFALLVPFLTNSFHIIAIVWGVALKQFGVESLKEYDPYPLKPLKWLYLLTDFLMAACIGVSAVSLALYDEIEESNAVYTIVLVSNCSVIWGTILCCYKTIQIFK